MTSQTIIEPIAPNAMPVFWEKADRSIVGPGQPEFLAMTSTGPTARYWVVALFEGLPIWINAMQLRSQRQFAEQVKPVVVTVVKEMTSSIAPLPQKGTRTQSHRSRRSTCRQIGEKK